MMLVDTHQMSSNPTTVPEAVSNCDTEEIDLGWKPDPPQRQKKGKQKPQERADLKLVEEESKVRRILFLYVAA